MRIEQLTFTRFIAAVSIVIFHFGKGSYLFNNKYVLFISQQANFGVSYFFILSGFVMIIANFYKENINVIDYYKNRLARVYPVYIVAIFLIIFANRFQSINISDLFLNTFMLQSWFPQKALTLNFPGWSLSVEMFFYISFPFLANKIYSKQKLKITAIWIISFWFISQIIFHLLATEIFYIPNYSSLDIHYNPLAHFNEFLIGNLTGLFFIRNIKNTTRNNLFLIIILMFLLIFLLRFPLGFDFHNGLLALIFAPFILLISSTNDKITAIFSHKIFIFLGEISFGIYILQLPVWKFFSDFRMWRYFGLDPELNFTSSFFIRLFILILVSSLSYLYFEKPLRNLIKKL